MSEFVDSPMSGEFQKQGSIPGPGPGQCNGETAGDFGSYKRTPSPNAVPEKTYDGTIKPSGEADQF
jgi:hypothetical protein